MFRPVANWAIAHRGARWLIEKTLGIAQGRKLPRFAARSFMRLAARRRLTRATRRSGRKVLYFVDTYANYHDPQLGEALVEVMQHNGIAVYVHPGQTSSAMPLISLGALGRAQTLARRNINLLAEAVRQGYQIVTTEPSAALALREEYPALVEDDDARVVAENTSEACTYLWKLHETGGLQLDLRPVNATIGYHMPCHLRALTSRLARRKLAAADSGARGATAGKWLLGHGGHLRPETRELSGQLAGRLGIDQPRAQSGHSSRRHRMQHLQIANGTGNAQSHDPSAQDPGPGLWADARGGRFVGCSQRRTGRHLTACGRDRGDGSNRFIEHRTARRIVVDPTAHLSR